MRPCQTPVAICVYNRPDFTRQLIDVLRTVRPARVLVIADGPRPGSPDDRARCDEVARVLQTIDWVATVDINRAPSNLGSRKRAQSGLAWVFDRVGAAIVLEDDCIPHASFFTFCSELLDRYRSDQRIGVISGSNFQFDAGGGPASYFFSRYPLIWGWAAWRRTWDHYDADLDGWPALRETPWLASILAEPLAAAYWRLVFDRMHGGMDAWDYALTFSCWRHEMLAIHPGRNLVRNIGFGRQATHTDMPDSIFANQPTYEMAFPLLHPARIERDVSRDARTEQLTFSGTPKQRLRMARDAIRRNTL